MMRSIPLRVDLSECQVLDNESVKGAIPSAGAEQPGALLPNLQHRPRLQVVCGKHEEPLDPPFKKRACGCLPVGVRREDRVALPLEPGEARLAVLASGEGRRSRT